MKFRETWSRYANLFIVGQLFWGYFLFVPSSLIRSEYFLPVWIAIQIALLYAYYLELRFFLRHGQELRCHSRKMGLDEDKYPGLGSLGVAWTIFAEALLGTFAFLYWAMSIRDPVAFSEELTITDSFYLAVFTFTTTGFGDIAPTSQTARFAVTVQMVMGFALVTVGLTLALSQFSAVRKRDES
jgi:hypothetical protein